MSDDDDGDDADDAGNNFNDVDHRGCIGLYH